MESCLVLFFVVNALIFEIFVWNAKIIFWSKGEQVYNSLCLWILLLVAGLIKERRDIPCSWISMKKAEENMRTDQKEALCGAGSRSHVGLVSLFSLSHPLQPQHCSLHSLECHHAELPSSSSSPAEARWPCQPLLSVQVSPASLTLSSPWILEKQMAKNLTFSNAFPFFFFFFFSCKSDHL